MNETDRELLEWAFKAYRPGENYIRMVNDAGYDYWNPITDDGDAFRLAVKLGLFISHSAYKPGENAYGFVGIAWYGQRIKFEPEKFTDDPYVATRRAIVRAAAQIGKDMV